MLIFTQTPKANSASSSRRNSVHTHSQHHRMLSNPTSPTISPSLIASSPTSPLLGFSRLSARDYFSPPISRRSMSPDAYASTNSELHEQSFISNPIPSPDFPSSGISSYQTAPQSFSSFASPSSDIFLDSSNEDVHSSSPPDSPQENDNSTLNDEEYKYRSTYPHSLDRTPDEDDEYTIHSTMSSHSANRQFHNRLSSAPSLGSFNSAVSTNERFDELQKTNTILLKKLRKNTVELESKLVEHETEVEELQTRIEDLKSELAVARREEKELKLKSVR